MTAELLDRFPTDVVVAEVKRIGPGEPSRKVFQETLVEIIEDTYVAFRRAMEFMVLNTTCQCNACANINTLDLKFFVHHGSYAIQKLGAHEELIGEDVNTAFRLMKCFFDRNQDKMAMFSLQFANQVLSLMVCRKPLGDDLYVKI